MNQIIEVHSVSKSFGGVQANQDISLSVKEGIITGLIGPNGSGKTTLFNSIVGQHPIDNGNILFQGKEISKLRVGEIARLGLLRTFQQTRIYNKMNCVDNMEISVSHRGRRFGSMFSSRKGEILDRAEELHNLANREGKRLPDSAVVLMRVHEPRLLADANAPVHPTLEGHRRFPFDPGPNKERWLAEQHPQRRDAESPA
mgnify:CR=1 FL=1